MNEEDLQKVYKQIKAKTKQKELIWFKGLLKKDGDFWFYKEKVNALYSIFDKMGYDREFVDKHIIS